MYMVVSRWEMMPGKEEEFERIGKAMRGVLRAQPGVSSVYGIREGSDVVAVVCYDDEATYQRIVKDPNGPFETAARQHGIENAARWVSSNRGEVLDD